MLETCRTHIAIADNLNAMGLRSKTVSAVNKWSQWPQSYPQQQQQKTLNPQNQHVGRNCTKSNAPGRVSCPAKDCTCQSCGTIGHWDIRCQSTSSKQKDPKKKPPRHGLKGGKQKQTHTVDEGDDFDPQCDELHVILIDVHPHHSAQLGWEPGDNHACPSALFPWVTQNAHSVTIVPPISMPYPGPSDQEHINIIAINIDALTMAWATHHACWNRPKSSWKPLMQSQHW